MNHSWRSLSLLSPILSLGLLLTACPGGGSPPNISDLPASLALAAKTSQVITGEFSFKNTGGSTLGYKTTVPASATWLGIPAGANGSVEPGKSQTVKASATCPATPGPLEADVVVASSSDSSISKTIKVTLVCSIPDITPDSFSLASVTGADPSSDVTSNEVTISGIDTPASVSASNGATVIINNSTALVGATVKNGDKLKITLKSSAAFATAVSSNITVGTFSTSFSVTTKAEPKLSVSFDPAMLSMKQGSNGSSNVAVVREGFTGDVSISTAPTFVADGVSVEPLTIAADKTTGVLKLTVSNDATVGQRDLPLIASGGGKTVSATIKITITGSSATPITSGGYTNIVTLVGKPITTQIPTIMGGTTPYKAAIDSALPAGLALDAATGGISGTATATATLKTYTITITDNSTPVQSITKSLDVTVNPALAIKTAYSNVNGTIGFDIKKPAMAVVEGGIPPYSYSIAPALPAGITLDITAGKIAGKPTVLYTSTAHTVTIKDSDGTTVTSPVKVSVNPVPQFTKGYQSLINEVTDPEKLPQTPELSGGVLPLNFTISPDLTAKTGIILDAATGTLSGMPTKPALEEKYTVTASDENGASSETNLRVLTIPRFTPKVTNTSVGANEEVKVDLKEIKVDFNKSVNATLDSMTLTCSYNDDGPVVVNIPFDGLPIVKSSTTTLALKSLLPQDSTCTLTVLKSKVADTLNPPLNMQADYVLTFKVEALYGKIDLQIALDPAQISYEDAPSNANPNGRSTSGVTITGKSFPSGQSFTGSQLIENVLGSSLGLGYSVSASNTTDSFGNFYKAYIIKDPEFSGFTDCSTPNTLSDSYVVKVNTTTVVRVVYCDPTVVRNTNDNGAGSLRELVASVLPDSTITFLDRVFDVAPAKTITLTGSNTISEIAINKSVNIFGPGASKLTVKPNNSNSAVASAPIIASQIAIMQPVVNQRVFNISGTSVISIIQSFTVRDGLVQDYSSADIGGGCIAAKAAITKLTLNKMAFVNCWAAGNAGNGSAILFEPDSANNTTNSLELNNVTATGNCAAGANTDLNICNASQTLPASVQPHNISAQNGQGGGYGGVVYLAGAKLTVHGGSYTGNHAAIGGGVIYAIAPNDSPSEPWITLQDGSYNNNTAIVGGALYTANSLNYNFISTADHGQQLVKKLGIGFQWPAITQDHQQWQALNRAAQPSPTPRIAPQAPSIPEKPALKVNNASFRGNSATIWGGAIYNEDLNGDFIKNTIDGNFVLDPMTNSGYGGGIYTDIYAGKLVFAENVITGNEANYGGGVVASSYSSSSIDFDDKNTISGNTASTDGGGLIIQAYGTSTIFIHKNTIEGNITSGSTSIAAGIHATGTNTSRTIIAANIIKNNKSAYDYGGIYAKFIDDAPFLLLDNTIIGNEAIRNGGGVVANLKANTVFGNNTISNNKAGQDYGGIFITSSEDIDLATNTISANKADRDGGGVVVTSTGDNVFNSNIISANKAGRDVGGVSATSTLSNTFRNNFIDTNSAAGQYGGVFLSATDNNMVLNNTISGNIAGANLGGIYAGSTNNTITNNTISGNSAGTENGGIYAAAAISNILKFNTIYKNTAVTQYGGLRISGPLTETSNLVAENTAPADPNSNVPLPNSIVSTALAPSALAALGSNNTTVLSGILPGLPLLTHFPTGPITSGAACDPAISTDQRDKLRPTAGSTCAYGSVQPPL
jgi:parallel beta-helix repeat protein